jgi:hypothetical protein
MCVQYIENFIQMPNYFNERQQYTPRKKNGYMLVH